MRLIIRPFVGLYFAELLFVLTLLKGELEVCRPVLARGPVACARAGIQWGNRGLRPLQRLLQRSLSL